MTACPLQVVWLISVEEVNCHGIHCFSRRYSEGGHYRHETINSIIKWTLTSANIFTLGQLHACLDVTSPTFLWLLINAHINTLGAFVPEKLAFLWELGRRLERRWQQPTSCSACSIAIQRGDCGWVVHATQNLLPAAQCHIHVPFCVYT